MYTLYVDIEDEYRLHTKCSIEERLSVEKECVEQVCFYLESMSGRAQSRLLAQESALQFSRGREHHEDTGHHGICSAPQKIRGRRGAFCTLRHIVTASPTFSLRLCLFKGGFRRQNCLKVSAIKNLR